MAFRTRVAGALIVLALAGWDPAAAGSESQPAAQFGRAVSVSGDTVVVGAPLEDIAGETEAGAAYVFVRSGATWIQQQKLLASDGRANDFFGREVSVSGDTLVVGASSHDGPGGANAGAAYVFVRSGTTWSEQQILRASDAGMGDAFGSAVSVSGDTVAVGAANDDTPGGQDAGSAYVFVRAGTAWTEEQKLLAPDGIPADLFGFAVSVSGDTVVVGMPSDTGVSPGAAYVFVRSGSVWAQQQKLVSSDGVTFDFFGVSVSVSGDTVAIGAFWDDTPAGPNAGSAYVFVRSGTTWTEQQKLLASDGAPSDNLGFSVSLSGDSVVAGAPSDDTPGGPDAGSAYVFVRSGATWSEQQKLLASDGAMGDAFGDSVAVSGDTVVAGAPLDDTPGGVNAGSAYVFVRGGTTWSEQQKVVPSEAADVAVSMTDSPDPVATGADLVYTIVVSNSGPDTAVAVQVAHPTPTGLVFVSNTGACTTPFPCAVGTVPAGQTRTITATYNVPHGYGGPNPIVSQATVTSATSDPNGANNAAAASTTVLFIPPSLEPGSIVVDGTGNGVFQPNETVIVAPSWRNAGLAAVTNVSGAASSFTGPPGPAYSIPDAAATYGTIAPGATVSCGTDCYRLTNAAAVRPTEHWDATFLEAVTPGTSTKTWRLHIGDSFTDVPASNAFYRFAETIFHHGITGGCSATRYCPTSATTREQMAVFVLVAKEGSGYVPAACATPVFGDVPASSPFCRWIEELARRGVAGGCGGGNYCPAAPVTREQMAVFVLRTLDPALDPPACGTPVFDDVPAGSPFCRWIEELARRGVVTGCGGGNYCPAASVTREQMSVFLSVTFGLALYGL